MVLKGEVADSYYVWSSYALLNQGEEKHARIALVEMYENDFNDDGKPDLVRFRIICFQNRTFIIRN